MVEDKRDSWVRCRNTTYDHPCHPIYAKKYNGYCLDCENAGVPDMADRVVELEALVRAQAERIAAQSELLSKVAELRAMLAPIVEFVRRVFLRGGSADEMPVSLGVNPVIGQCCTFGDLRRLAALALVPTTEVADG